MSVAKKSKKADSNSKKGEEKSEESILAEYFMLEQKWEAEALAARRKRCAPVIVEIVDDLRALIYRGGKLLAQPECGENPDLFQIEQNGYDLIHEVIGFLWLCRAPNDEDSVTPTIRPTQLTAQHARQWFDLDEKESE